MREYDSSWDRSSNGDKFETKYREWKRRNWKSWLQKNLSFPFEIERMEDMDMDLFDDYDRPFAVGHRMTALELGEEDDQYGFLIFVKGDREKGWIPLADVEVTSRNNPNFWPVREYVVWIANR
ncbi:hypothetical protein JW926_13005 [Candidatus Sumerlaeota bacterium]|nr:hypothetical protein [Candidatus Sumerlaeota bacterium]